VTNRVTEASPRELTLLNQQRVKPLRLRRVREFTVAALTSLPDVNDWQLAFHFAGARKMAHINETHLHHPGPTDVITFDYNDPAQPHRLVGDVFICVDVAVEQAREFRTTWQEELARYIVHALLHLCGHDDLAAAPRRRMKQAENRLVRQLSRQFRFNTLSR
jgi:rRNA maturation RNase YbeY